MNVPQITVVAFPPSPTGNVVKKMTRRNLKIGHPEGVTLGKVHGVDRPGDEINNRLVCREVAKRTLGEAYGAFDDHVAVGLHCVTQLILVELDSPMTTSEPEDNLVSNEER